MDNVNRILYKGFILTGDGTELSPGHWECHLLVEKPGYVAEQFQILPAQPSASEAVQFAFASGRRMADSVHFSLSPVQEEVQFFQDASASDSGKQQA